MSLNLFSIFVCVYPSFKLILRSTNAWTIYRAKPSTIKTSVSRQDHLLSKIR